MSLEPTGIEGGVDIEKRVYEKTEKYKQTTLSMRSKDANRLKAYYAEYCNVCASNSAPHVGYKDFVVHFLEYGFLEWREKERNRGK